MQKQTKPSRETNKQKISYSFSHLPAPEQAKENEYLSPPKQTFIPSQTNKRKNKAKNKQEKTIIHHMGVKICQVRRLTSQT